MHDMDGSMVAEVPADYICPITGEIMENPVVAADGQSYESSAIAEWIAIGHCDSPLTGEKLKNSDLTPNFRLRAIIQDFKGKQQNSGKQKIHEMVRDKEVLAKLEEEKQKNQALQMQLTELHKQLQAAKPISPPPPARQILPIDASSKPASQSPSSSAADEKQLSQIPMERLKKLAEEGDADAGASLGRNYLYGKQTRENLQEGERWLLAVTKRTDSAAGIWARGICHERGIGHFVKDANKAFAYYQKAATRGYVQAQYDLATAYENGRGVVKNKTEAMKWYHLAAQRGNADAQCDLGWCYERGKGVKKDLKEARRFYTLSAAHGNPNAEAALKILEKPAPVVAPHYPIPKPPQSYIISLLREIEGRPDLSCNMQKLKELAMQGNVDAEARLGRNYFYGRQTVKDRKEGEKWLLLAASQPKNAAGMWARAMCHKEEIGTFTGSLDHELHCYRSAAKQNYAPAQSDLGLCYYEEREFDIDEDPQYQRKVLQLYQMAAKNGCTDAEINLGRFLRNVEVQGISDDECDMEVMRLFHLAAEQGNAEAQYEYGCLCADGIRGLIAADKKAAIGWYLLAAQQGYADAEFKLWQCHDNGIGVEKDVNIARKWLYSAAEHGSCDAQYILARFYQYGTGVEVDKEKAEKWLRMAADQGDANAKRMLTDTTKHDADEKELAKGYQLGAERGDPLAQNSLAVCYEHGMGIAQDKIEAAKWYRKAAEQGNTLAQNNLALCYEEGIGVEKDEKEAVKWYNLAAAPAAPQALNERQLAAFSYLPTAAGFFAQPACLSSASSYRASSSSSTSSCDQKENSICLLS